MLNQNFSFVILLATLSLTTRSAFARGANAEEHAKQIKFYEAWVGNHDSVHVEVDENWTLVSKHTGPNKTVYILDWPTQTIRVLKGETSLELSPASSDYLSSLKMMRDLAAYTTVPQRYTWGVAGTEPLNLEVNETTQKLDELLSRYQAFSANCVVYADANANRLEVSAGAFGDLGNLKNAITGAWVRGGYELVLVPAAGFELSEGPAFVVKDNQGQDATFDLHEQGQRTGSLACRPTLF